jgi:hypothetical protein
MKKKRRNTKKKKEVVKVDGLYQEAIAFAADAFREGHSEVKVAEVIKGAFKHLTDANVQFIIHKGSQSIADQYQRDRKSIVALHVKRYNQEIKKVMDGNSDEIADNEDVDGEDGDPAKKRKIRIYQLMICLDVMRSKEKVLQIHNKETQIKIFNKLNAKIKEKKVMFNLEGLSFAEKMEFLQLILKAKKSQVELHGIKLNAKEDVDVIEDAEIISIETVNIEKIKKVNEKLKELPEPKKVLGDITNKIKQALQNKALKEIEAKGGNKGGPHILDYTKKK